MWVALALGLSNPAFAVDGVLEINQTCAVNTGCFSGDTAGFPVTITATGSYRLTSNLTVPDENTGGINVSANDVAIDLNNFAIIGPVTCSGSPLTCSHASGSGIGIYTSHDGISVKNGSITGMGYFGLWLDSQADVASLRLRENRVGNVVGPGSTISGTTAYSNGSYGISAGEGSLVSGNTAFNNVSVGIYAVASTVSGNTVHGNGTDGILIQKGSTVSGNTAYDNGGDGIQVLGGSTVFNNAASSNDGFGINLGSTSAYRGNVLTDNGGGGVSGGINRGSNYCDGPGVLSPDCP